MRRRDVLTLTLASVVAWAARSAEAQQAVKRARVGRLSPISGATDERVFQGFRHALRDLGWVEGANVTFEYRFAEGRLDRLPALARELVQLKVDLIVAGSVGGALAAKNATGTIPIVMVTTGDPVASGLVASFARPDGNITGVTALIEALSAKRLELLKEVVPGIARVGILTTPAYPAEGRLQRELEEAARVLGLQLRMLQILDPGEFEQAFATMSREGVGALMVGPDPMFNTHRVRLVELAAKHHLPTMYGLREFVEVGGLMFYGASLPHMYVHAATFADKILKGTRPANLPIEQPTKFELVINLRAAKALGLTIPPILLLRSDEVIK
jgi:putative ABC transport system substrate-binding protein